MVEGDLALAESLAGSAVALARRVGDKEVLGDALMTRGLCALRHGDTRTASWRLLAGASALRLAPVASAVRTGFETALRAPGSAAYVAVQALDSGGAVIGTSKTIRG